MLISVLGDGYIDREKIRVEVKDRLEKLDVSTASSSFRNSWHRALNDLEKEGRISKIPAEIHLIQTPYKDQVELILQRLRKVDDPYICEIALRQLLTLTDEGYSILNPEIVDALELIILQSRVMSTPTMLGLFLQTCENIQSLNEEKQPEGYIELNTRIDNLLGRFYQSLHSKSDFNIIEAAIRLIPKRASSKKIVDFLFNQIKSMEDEEWKKVRFRISWSFFDKKYAIAELYRKYIDETLTSIVLGRTKVSSVRARWLLSHKIEGMQGGRDFDEGTTPNAYKIG